MKATQDLHLLQNLLVGELVVIYREFRIGSQNRPRFIPYQEITSYDWSEVQAIFSTNSSRTKVSLAEPLNLCVLELPLFIKLENPYEKKASLKNLLRANSPWLFNFLKRVKNAVTKTSFFETPLDRLQLLKNSPDLDQDTVLIAMHWLQLGGAEKFAIETMEWLHSKGKKVIVVADQHSKHDWLSKIRQKIEAAYLISDVVPPQLFSHFYNWVIGHHNVGTIHIHHAFSCYEALPSIKTTYPIVRVFDSLHILELPRYNYGYPRISANADRWIDVHHVISHQLISYFAEERKISSSKLILGMLVPNPSQFHPIGDRSKKRETCIGFLGRFSDQKRPIAFVRVAALLKDHKNYKFLMCGSGPLLKSSKEEAIKLGLQDRMTFREEVRDPIEFYRDIDLFLLPSENEGIALVSFESMLMNIPILMPNVGAQRELIPSWLLVSAENNGLEERLASKAQELLADKETLLQRSRSLREIVERLSENHQIPVFLEKLYSSTRK